MNLDKIILPLDKIFPKSLVPDPTGLVALGGTLSVMTLIEAYSKGIFPWAGNHPIPWYSPDPRLVLFPTEFHTSKSLRKILRKNDFEVRFDNDFTKIIGICAELKRKHQHGTWIDENIISAYSKLFELNIAHCIAVYQKEELYGGLYGLYLGNTFFGESMFSLKPNGSKIALSSLCDKCIALNISLIDCQQSTPHLISLGAREISRTRFLSYITESMKAGLNLQKW